MSTSPGLKIVILGSGGLGRYYASRLQSLDPVVVGHTVPPYRVIDQHGAQLIHPAFRTWEEIPAVSPDVVLLAIKWVAMIRAQTWLRQHAPHAYVISVMNGMGQEEALASLRSLTLAVGVTTDAVTRVDRPGEEPTVMLRAEGATTLPLTRDPRENRLIQAVQSCQLNWHWNPSSTLIPIRWQKLMQNSVINPLTALANCPNGVLPSHPLWRLAKPLLGEGRAVAQVQNIPLPDDLENRVFALTQKTQENISSMLQDIRRGTSTEITAINGYISRQAHLYGLNTPTHDALIQLIRTMETQGGAHPPL